VHARAIAREVASELLDAGADAVVLGGSVARGDQHAYSDIDIVALSADAVEHPPYALRIVHGRLVSVSWSTADGVRQLLDAPQSAGATVPAWRSAEILVDTRLRARSLQQFAHEWRWARIAEACDGWIAAEFPAYAEEVFRLAGQLERGNELVVAVMRSVLALRLPALVAVQRRLFYESENELWQLVADTVGGQWGPVHRAALGIGCDNDSAARAALSLWALAAAEVDGVITDPDDRAVVRAATDIAESVGGATRRSGFRGDGPAAG